MLFNAVCIKAVVLLSPTPGEASACYTAVRLTDVCLNISVLAVTPKGRAINRSTGSVIVLAAISFRLARLQGKYTVGPFTDKARIADYIREKHGGTMIGVFPAMAGFYTVFAGMPHLRPRCAAPSA